MTTDAAGEAPVDRPVRPLLAGCKQEGVGASRFHAADARGDSLCGNVILGDLQPASEIPENLRCRAPGCRQAFERA